MDEKMNIPPIIPIFLISIFFLSFGNLLFAQEDKLNFAFSPELKAQKPSKNKADSLVFVILTHVRNESDSQLWRRCYNSVRKFYPSTLIVIIDDNSLIPVSIKDLKKTLLIQSEYPGAGELLPYYYFLRNKWANKMIFLHDSMLLKRSFSHNELKTPIKFHWFFKSHGWDNKPAINSLLAHLNYSEDLIDYNMNKNDLWHGCFGVASIIDIEILKKIERKYQFPSNLISTINSREQRCALERVFAILMFSEGLVNKDNCANFGNIINFPQWSEHVDDEQLKQLHKTYPGAILKTWHGR